MQSSTFKISIAKDFSTTPAGRFISDGPTSGQVFREKLLIPALQAHALVCVDLDGTEGYGSSFLEEAFGGLIREHGFDRGSLEKQLSFISTEDDSLIVEIKQYLEFAHPKATGLSQPNPKT